MRSSIPQSGTGVTGMELVGATDVNRVGAGTSGWSVAMMGGMSSSGARGVVGCTGGAARRQWG